MANGVKQQSTRAGGVSGAAPRSVSALMLLISLATYDPRDPALFFKSGASGSVRNFIGPVGAFLAELLIPQLFGVAALLLPIVLGITGWKLFWCKPIDAPYTKAAGLTLLMLSLTAFLRSDLRQRGRRGRGRARRGRRRRAGLGPADGQLQPDRARTSWWPRGCSSP